MYYGVLTSGTSFSLVSNIGSTSTCPWLSTLLLLTLTSWKPVQGDTEIMYEFLDNITSGDSIGNIKKDSKLHRRYSEDELKEFSFAFLERTVHHADQQYFRLRAESGNLRASKDIDRDAICSNKPVCMLHLDIAVQPAKYFQIMRVIIILHDLNDNAPVFAESEVDFTVSEAVPTGPLLYLSPAEDPDADAYSVQRYELLDGEDLFDFEVAETGDIRIHLLKSLNREEKSSHTLTLVAYDGGEPPKSGNMTFTIYVDDVNDNVPKFIDPAIVCNVGEDTLRGSVLLYVHAIDLDQGRNGELRYMFTNSTNAQYGSIFKLNSKSGSLELDRPLDREEQDMYALEVIARDSGPFSIPAEAKIIVNVLDINDNIPEITISPLIDNKKILVIDDKAVGSTIAHVSVRDEDSGENGRINCSLAENSEGHFEIVKKYDEEYQILLKSALDREVKNKHTITLMCNDFGSPQLFREVAIPIVVEDAEAHTPNFERELYTRAIYENSDPMPQLLKVKATEPEAGLNGVIVYKLGREAGNVFKIDESTGVIATVTSFNREEIGDVVEFRVLAIDQSLEADPRTATATVQVTVIDVDDEPPRFTQAKYIFNIHENLPKNTSIGVVSAYDRDLYPHTDFSFFLDLTNPNVSRMFHIDPKTGEMSSRVSFDRETQAIHNVNLLVRGDTNPHLQDRTLVQVYITDINDNAPNITYPNINHNKVYVSCETKIGKQIGEGATIDAHDPDEGLNGMLTYHFTNDSGTTFRIDENNGTIFVNADIKDYVHKFFPVKVIVRDKGIPPKWSRTVFHIIVTNQFSTLNTWDKYSLEKDRGLSMEVRVSIIVIVVVMSMVSIIGFSIAIRIYSLRKKPAADYYEDSHIHTNGFIPNSCQSFASSAENATSPNGDVFYVKSRKRSKSIASMSTTPSSSAKDTPAEEIPMLEKEKEMIATSDGRVADDEDSEVTEPKRHVPEDADRSSDQTSSQQRKSVHFEEHMDGGVTGYSRKSSIPEELWDALDVASDKLKYSIPGVCTIIAASSDESPTHAEPLLRQGRRKMPRVPNENIVRYTRSLASERGLMMHPSPPPIPKHVPPPIHITSPMAAQVRTFHYRPTRGALPVYIKTHPNPNRLTIRHKIPAPVPRSGVSTMPNLRQFYAVPPHTFSGQAHMVKFDKTKRRPISQTLFADSPEDSDGSYI